MSYYPISLQLNEKSKELLDNYSYALLDSKTPSDLDDALERALVKSELTATEVLKNPDYDWVEPLHADLIKLLESDTIENKKIHRSVMSSFFIRINIRYSSGINRPFRRLSGVSTANFNIQAPHFKWLRDLDEQFEILTSENPDIKQSVIYGHLLKTKDLGLSLEQHVKIHAFIMEEGFGSDIRDEAEDFLRSSRLFKGTELTKEKADKIKSTAQKWKDNKDSDELIVMSIMRNYEIHPLHENLLKAFLNKENLIGSPVILCHYCGEAMIIDDNGIANHIDTDGNIDHDADADHTATSERD